MITFLDHYDSFSYNLIDWLVGKNNTVCLRHIFCDKKDQIEEWRRNPTPLVLSPGPKAPEDYPHILELISSYQTKVPILGVCLGHQMIAVANHAKIIPAKKPHHGSSRRVFVSETHPLRCKLPRCFRAATYNSLVADRKSLPPENIFAINDLDEVEGIFFPGIQWHTIGVQFHPESFLSENQHPLLNLFLDQVQKYCTHHISSAGRNHSSDEAPLSIPS